MHKLSLSKDRAVSRLELRECVEARARVRARALPRSWDSGLRESA